jgi:hypothetical protein
MNNPREFFESLLMDKLPAEAVSFIEKELLTDSDLNFVTMEEEEMADIVSVISSKFPRALGIISDPSEMEQELSGSITTADEKAELQELVEGFELLLEDAEGDERTEIEELIEGYKLLLEEDDDMFERGGEVEFKYTKGELIKLAYSEDELRNIDTALPMETIRQINDLGLNGFFFVMNYNDNVFGRIENIASMLLSKHYLKNHRGTSVSMIAEEVLGKNPQIDYALPIEITREMIDLGIDTKLYVMDYSESNVFGTIINLAEEWINRGHLEKHRHNEGDKFAKGGEVEIQLGKNYNIVYEKPDSDIAYTKVINANSEIEAAEKFKAMHPTCSISSTREAYCDGGCVCGGNKYAEGGKVGCGCKGAKFAKGGEVGHTVEAVIEFSLIDKENRSPYLNFLNDYGKNKGFDKGDLYEVESLGNGSYKAIFKSYSINFEGLKGQELQDELDNTLSDQFDRYSDCYLQNVTLIEKYSMGGILLSTAVIGVAGLIGGYLLGKETTVKEHCEKTGNTHLVGVKLANGDFDIVEFKDFNSADAFYTSIEKDKKIKSSIFYSRGLKYSEIDKEYQKDMNLEQGELKVSKIEMMNENEDVIKSESFIKPKRKPATKKTSRPKKKDCK